VVTRPKSTKLLDAWGESLTKKKKQKNNKQRKKKVLHKDEKNKFVAVWVQDRGKSNTFNY